MQGSRVRLTAILGAMLLSFGAASAGHAHNRIVHQDIVEFAYETMLLGQAATKLRFVAFPPPAGADPNEWGRFIQLLRETPAKWKAMPSELHRLDLAKLAKPPVKPLDLAPGGPGAVAKVQCSDEIYDTKELPEGWWNAKMGDVHYPVSIDFAQVGDCGVRYGWTPGGLFDNVNSVQSVGADHVDHTGLILGMWAANVDNEVDDTHLWNRPTSMAGAGFVQKVVDDAIDRGLETILLPLVCLADCIFGDCDDCDRDAKDLADAANPVDDVMGLVPGFGDTSGEDWVGVWHYINMNPGLTNEYDDHQGELFEEAGPHRIPAAEDLALMAWFDLSGLSVHYDPSHGPKRYQVSNPDDGLPDTRMRNESQWQFTTVGHTAFEPVDNLAYYGWRLFRDGNPGEGIEKHRVSYMAWPLHALGDATVPMHVSGTSSWGHRPYEDAQERLWQELRQANTTPAAGQMLVRVLQNAFEYWRFVEQWRATTGRHDDVPIRELVTRLAQHSYDYSIAKSDGGAGWPFLPLATAAYFVKATRESSIALYTARPDAASLGRPLIEDGIAATIAVLITAGDLLPAPPTD